MTSQPPVLSETLGAVQRLTMNRPETRNALGEEMIAALLFALAAAAEDDTVRAVIIAGAGPSFCSGHDLKEMLVHRGDIDGGKAAFAAMFSRCSRLMQTIMRHPKPVIAQVHGTATAAGCQLVASCDLAVASSAATFATPGVNIGLFCSTPAVALSRNVARKHAMEMLLTGGLLSAAKAWHFGLVNSVVSPQALAEETIKLALLIASKPCHAIRIGKEAFYHQIELGLDEAYAYASRVMAENMLHAEAEEGISAFLEKREPKWPQG